MGKFEKYRAIGFYPGEARMKENTKKKLRTKISISGLSVIHECVLVRLDWLSWPSWQFESNSYTINSFCKNSERK